MNGPGLTENRTPETVLRIRITAPIDLDAFAEYDVQRFRVGDVYEVPIHLGSLLIIAGFADSADGAVPATEAVDFSRAKPLSEKKSF